MKNIIILFIALFTSNLYSQTFEADSILAQQYFSEGSDLIGEGEVSDIFIAFDKALEIYHKYPEQTISSIAIITELKGKAIRLTSDYKKALTYYEEAQSLFQKDKSAPLEWVYENLTSLGLCHYRLGDRPLAQQYFQQAIKGYETKPPQTRLEGLRSAYTFSGHHHRNQGQIDSMVYYYQKALEYDIDFWGPNSAEVGYDYIVLGTAYQIKQEHRKAIEIFERGTDIVLKANGPEGHLLDSYSYIGASYVQLGELNKGLDYYKEAEHVLHRNYPPEHRYWGYYCSFVVNVHLKMENFAEALHWGQKGLMISEKNLPANHPNLGHSHLNLGMAYSELNQLQQARVHLEKALNIWNIQQTNNYISPRAYYSIGETYLKEQQLDSALLYFNTSLELASKIWTAPHADLLIPHHFLGKTYAAQNNHEKALQHYDLALKMGGYDLRKPWKNRSFQRAIPLFKTLINKAEFLHQHFEKTQKMNSLNQALSIYQSSTALMDTLLVEYRNSDALTLIKVSYPLLEQAIYAHYLAFQQSGEIGYLKKALAFSEKSKSLILYKTVLEKSAQEQSLIPDSLLVKEKEIKQNIYFYEKQLNDLLQDENTTDSLLIETRSQIAEQKRKLSDFIDLLDKNYPEYRQLKYQFQSPTLTQIQHKLPDHALLLQYFQGDEHLFVFKIAKNTSDILLLEAPNLAETVQNIRRGVYEFPILAKTKNIPTNIHQLYVQNAHQLYQQLISPLGTLPEQLIIVPDGILNYIPFELLLTEAPADPKAFKFHAYLNKQHQISYNYSVTLWQEMKKKAHHNSELLAFAPTFEQEALVYNNPEDYRRDNLGSLLFNTHEVAAIQKLIGGTIKSKEAATAATFFEEASNYGILHFATHAKVEDKNSNFSWLAFQDDGDSLTTDKVYLRDLYNMNIPAQMVVLSACETGIGELQKGEGVISLARGFAYAGAKSIITSLWKANDQATANLMTLFYENLKTGMTKDAALQQAKMTYINNVTSHEDAHPTKWATFVAIGDMQPIKSSRNWMWCLGGILLLSAGIYLFLKK